MIFPWMISCESMSCLHLSRYSVKSIVTPIELPSALATQDLRRLGHPVGDRGSSRLALREPSHDLPVFSTWHVRTFHSFLLLAQSLERKMEGSTRFGPVSSLLELFFGRPTKDEALSRRAVQSTISSHHGI